MIERNALLSESSVEVTVRLLNHLEEFSECGKLVAALRDLDGFIHSRLCPHAIGIIFDEPALEFPVSAFCSEETRRGILVQALGRSSGDSADLQRRIARDFDRIRNASCSGASKVRRSRGDKAFVEVVAEEIAVDLTTIHHERLLQSLICFDLQENMAALLYLRDYAGFLEDGVAPYVRCLVEFSRVENWLELPDLAIRFRGASQQETRNR